MTTDINKHIFFVIIKAFRSYLIAITTWLCQSRNYSLTLPGNCFYNFISIFYWSPNIPDVSLNRMVTIQDLKFRISRKIPE